MLTTLAEIQESVRRERRLLGVEPFRDPPQVRVVSTPAWVLEGYLYEVFLRTVAEEKPLAVFKAELPRLKKLGVKTIWLMPFHPTGEQGRKGRLGSPYSIKDHFAIDPALGTESELRELISAAHDLDMRVIGDFVANHVALYNTAPAEYPQMIHRNAEGKPVRRITDWSDICDLDYTQPRTRHYMKSVARYWIEEFDLDGFRCDVAGLVPLDFWEQLSRELLKIKKDIFLMAEWEAISLFGPFHACYDWTLYNLMTDVHKRRRSLRFIAEYITMQQAVLPENALMLRFTENHDLPRTRAVFGRESFYNYVALAAALPGITLIYGGQESGAIDRPSLFDKPATKAPVPASPLKVFYSTLGRWMRKISEYKNGRLVIRVEENEKLLVLKYGTDKITFGIYLNFSERDFKYEVRKLSKQPVILFQPVTGDETRSKPQDRFTVKSGEPLLWYTAMNEN